MFVNRNASDRLELGLKQKSDTMLETTRQEAIINSNNPLNVTLWLWLLCVFSAFVEISMFAQSCASEIDLGKQKSTC